MSAARHFFAPGTIPDTDLKADITADITAAHRAQRDMAATGQQAIAYRMGQAVDEHLDELTALKNGTWRPNHA